MARLIVVRHAQSEGNAAGLLVGTGDPPLSERGRNEAKKVGTALKTVAKAVIISSPSVRAIETAEAIAGAIDPSTLIEIDPALAEMDYGEWEGTTFDELGGAGEVVRLFGDAGFAPPGGESLGSLVERVSTRLADISKTFAERDVVIVTHMGPVKAAAIWSLGAPIETFPRFRIDNASITRIRILRGMSFLVTLNEISHLRREQI